MSNNFVSAFDVAVIADSIGNLTETKDHLIKQLSDLKINIDNIFTGLPSGLDGDREAISRLVSLARANGLCLQVTSNSTNKSKNVFNIISPASVGLLQAGHHKTISKPEKSERQEQSPEQKYSSKMFLK